MDGTRFDTLARSFGGGRTRRDALKGLAATLLGLGVARDASAQVGGELATCGQSCRNSDDCNAGLRCNREGGGRGRCTARRSTDATCNRNADCRVDYEVCVNRRCVNQVECGVDRCNRDSDCLDDEVCRDNRCKVRRDRDRCDRDAECRNDEVCRNGRCEVRGDRCNRDRDCRSGEECVNNRCERAGERCDDNNDCRSNEKCRRNRCVRR